MDYIGFYSQHVDDLTKEGSQYRGRCPFHADEDKQMKGFFLNPNDGIWHCFSCNKGGNCLTFCKEKRIPVTQAPDYDRNYAQYAYAGGVVKKKHKKEKRSYWDGAKGRLPQSPYNPQGIELAREHGKRLWVCEGEKDTLTLLEAGELAIGLSTPSSYRVLERISFIGIPEVIVAMDHDKTGRETTARIARHFPFVLIVNWPEGTPEHFDVTNLKEKHPRDFVRILRSWTVDTDPYGTLDEILKNKYRRDMSRDPDKLLGYECNKFRDFAKNLDGIQPGLYVVAAETNVGKTAFLCNLTLDLLESNDGLAGVYFCLDDRTEVILNRMLSIKTGIPLNSIQRPQKTKKYEKIQKEGYQYLTKFVRDGRLFIRDASEIRDRVDLELEMRRRMNRKVFVVIDSLYNFEMSAGGSDRPREAIERMNKLKPLLTSQGIPVICTWDLRRPNLGRERDRPPSLDDLVGSGEIVSIANAVLLIYPENPKDYDNADEPVLIMKYVKNKLSHFRGEIELRFYRPMGRIKETGHDSLQDIGG